MLDQLTTYQKLLLLVKLKGGGGGGTLKTLTGNLPLTVSDALNHAIASLTRYGKCEQRNLPQGYTELTYLQSNGSQLLQLDITRQSGKAYAMQADLEASVFGSTSSGLFTLGSDYAGYCVVSRKWNTTNMVMMSGSVESSGLVYTGRATYTVSVAADGLTCTLSDGTNTASYTRTSANYSNKPVLFGLDTNYKGTCKIYSAKLWEDDVLKFDLVPCMNADGVCGMFNRVDGSFIVPIVGALAAGDVVTPSPEHPVDIVTNNGPMKVRRQSGSPLLYQAVEWLKPSDAIPITGFKTKSTQEIECVFYRESSASSYLYWSDTASSGTTNTTAYLTTSVGNWRWDGKTYSIGVSSGIKITSIQNKDGVWLNGTKYGYYTDAGEFVSTNDLSLASYTNTSIRIYSLTIREGETVTLDLVPKQRITDGVYGFYDKVSGNFYTNDEATFEAGPVVDDPVEIYTDGEDEVLTVSGAQMLDPATSNIIIGETVPADGSFVVGLNNWRTDYIPIVGGKTYAFWGRKKEGNTISAYNRINWYTADKVNIAPRPSYTINTVTIATAPSNAAYAILSCAPINSSNPITRDTFDEYNWMFAEAAQEIPYEPYVTPQTVTDIPMLLGVGDAKDEVELINGIKTGKVGIKVLDGTEEDLAFNTQYNVAYFYIQDKKVGVTDFTPLLCTHLRNNSVAFSDMGYGEIASTKRDNGINMRVSSAITSLALLKQWLASEYANGTPVIVLYPLATETTEQTDPHSLVTHKGTNIVDSTANVEPVEAEIEYYGTEVPMLGMMMPAPSAPEEPAEEPSDEPQEPNTEGA